MTTTEVGALPDRPEHLRVLYHLVVAIGRAETVNEVYEAALSCLQEAVGSDRASILTFDAGGVMRFRAWRGLSDEYRRMIEGHSPWARGTRNATPLVVPDVRTSPELARFRTVFAAERVAAVVFLPLTYRGELLGKFTVCFGSPRSPGADELRLAEAIAHHVAFAVERARVRDEAERAAAQTERLQRLVAALAAVLTPSEAASVLLREVSSAFGASAGSVALANELTGELELMAVLGYDPKLVDLYRSIPVGAPLPLAEAFRGRRTILGNTVDDWRRLYPDLVDRHADRRLHPAWAAVPLLLNDRVLGVLGLSFDHPQTMGDDDRDQMETMASQGAQALERARLFEQERWAREIAEAAQQRLAQANETLRAVVRASPLGIMLLDAGGTVRLWNPAAERIFGWSADQVLGRPLPAVAEAHGGTVPVDLSAWAARTGEEGLELRLGRRDGGTFEAAVWVAALQRDAGLEGGRERAARDDVQREAPQHLAVVADVTATKRGARRQRIQLAVTRVLAAADSLDRAIPELLSAVGAGMGWNASQLWLLDRDVQGGATLRWAGTWSAGIDDAARFESENARLTFTTGVGLPGRVFAGGRAVHTVELTEEPALPRRELLARFGFRSGVGFPITAGGEVLGVVEAFQRDGIDVDDELLQTLDSIGAQVGQFWKRKEAEGDRERLFARASFLANVSRVFASSLEAYQAALRTVARMLVPALADACVIMLADPSGALTQVAEAAAEPGAEAALLRLRAQYGPGAAPAAIAGEVLAGGRTLTFVAPAPAGDDADAAADAGARSAAAALAALGLRAAAVVPIRARGQVLGLLGLGLSRSGGRLDAPFLSLAEELAERAGMAIDNAQLYRESREAVRLRDDFLSIAGHELKTPLTALGLQLVALKRLLSGSAAAEPDRLRAKADVIGRQVDRLGRLIDALLDVARLSAGRLELQREELDLTALAEEVVARFNDEAARVGSSFRVRSSGPAVGTWDRMRIDQVVTNLISNAVKYGRGGVIDLEVATQPGKVTLVVRDQGIGISPEQQGRIFDRFERAVSSNNYGGLGLGLWIARQMVEAHGGVITVESSPGAGSCFTVVLPS